MKTSRFISCGHFLALAGLISSMASAADITNPPPVYKAPPTPPQVVEQAQPTTFVTSPVPVAAPGVAPVNPAPQVAGPAKRSAADLEKLVAPIALYPDPLIAAILPASAYPVEVVLAARFVRDTNNIAKVKEQPWDENIKTVARVPEVVQKMNDDLPWTVDLGQAFVTQQSEVLDAVQRIRARAQAAGVLKSTPEQTVTITNVVLTQANGPTVVTVTNEVVQIQPAQPGVVYLPHYDPQIVYTTAPGYYAAAPVYYAPAPVYYTPAYYYDPWLPLVTFGVGVWWGSTWWGNCDNDDHDGHHHNGGHDGNGSHDGNSHNGGSHDGGSHNGQYTGNTSSHSTSAMPHSGAGSNTSTARGQQASAMPHTASTTQWQPDANRLRTSSTSIAAPSQQPRVSSAVSSARTPAAPPAARSASSTAAAPRSSTAAATTSRWTTSSGLNGGRNVAASAWSSAPKMSSAPTHSFNQSQVQMASATSSRAVSPSAAPTRTWASTSPTSPSTSFRSYGAAPSFSRPSSPTFGGQAPSSFRGASTGGGMSSGAAARSFSSGGSFSRGSVGGSSGGGFSRSSGGPSGGSGVGRGGSR